MDDDLDGIGVQISIGDEVAEGYITRVSNFGIVDHATIALQYQGTMTWSGHQDGTQSVSIGI